MINLEHHCFLKPLKEIMNVGSDHQSLSKTLAEKMKNKAGPSTKGKTGDSWIKRTKAKQCSVWTSFWS